MHNFECKKEQYSHHEEFVESVVGFSTIIQVNAKIVCHKKKTNCILRFEGLLITYVQDLLSICFL